MSDNRGRGGRGRGGGRGGRGGQEGGGGRGGRAVVIKAAATKAAAVEVVMATKAAVTKAAAVEVVMVTEAAAEVTSGEAVVAAATSEVVEAAATSGEVVGVAAEVGEVVILVQTSCNGLGQPIPPPDEEVSKLEDTWIKQQDKIESKLPNLSLGDSDHALLPGRPGLGTGGSPIVLWANYFKMDARVLSLYRYDLRVTSKKVTKEEEETTKPKPKEKSGGGGGGQSSANEPREPKGKKLANIIQLALDQLPGKPVVATEYKQQLITKDKLKLPAGGHMQIDLVEPGRSTETWFVRFDGPSSINVKGLMDYLKLMEKDNDGVFPKYPEEIDTLGVVLGHTPRSNPGAAAVGRSRFFAVDTRKDGAMMGDRSLIEILRGYVQSVRPATGRLLLNTNVTHGVFRRGFKLDELFRLFQVAQLHQPRNLPGHAGSELERLHKFLSKTRIRCKVPGDAPGKFFVIERGMAGLANQRDGGKAPEDRPQFTLTAVRFGAPTTVKFYLRAPKTPGTPPPAGLAYNTWVFVSDYYRARYGISVDPGLPLINVGTSTKPIYIPAEFCELLPGQPLKSRLSPQEQDSMIQFACRPPPANAQSITTAARNLLALDNNKLLDNFGITVHKRLITVRGRELIPPKVSYMKGTRPESVTPADGSWLMKGVRVCRSGRHIGNWTYLTIGNAPRAEEIRTAVWGFAKFLNNNMGISMNTKPNPPNGYVTPLNHTDTDLEKLFRRITTQTPRPDLLLVIIPSKDAARYNSIKKFGDCDFGLPTVCVREEMITKQQGQAGYFANVGLKVNLKFGGVNHRVEDKTGIVAKTMFVGYDVTHPTNLPAGAGENAPSLVGLVASIDQDLAQWPAVTWANRARVEKVGQDDGGQFVRHFKDRLRLWQDHNKKQLPEYIVIFRDGVSEGQFNMVLKDELPHIRQACRETYPAKQQPRISLIVSVKRHQTRFYPTDPNHIHFRSKSPKEGTIVDRGVTNVRCWDFFLQAHASLQGTARPAHYTVLLDEIFRSKFKQDAANMLEKLTHDMCYAYGRATKAVSICPPAYYADLVATRARIHKNELFDDSLSLASGGTNSSAFNRGIHDKLKNTMYYI
ncbi:ribonuclease H-like domain-containing protein [Chaetomium fimeti]|uniref:Ribonuclease H-like domain-containing protein n=1 Tax=Chaetomium fimeti TaxID=1854472 RepID=A0AAE0H9R8_9PEZI|nr:ribonuclease H-like domain-containing protein [Chaetomium fimeti]